MTPRRPIAAGRRRPRRARRPPAAPRLLTPILVAWERVERRRRHIRPARPGAVVGVELRRHAGSDVCLGDGTLVRAGDLLGELHLDNRRLLEVTEAGGWWAAVRVGMEDLRAVARWAAREPQHGRPVAFHGQTLLAPFAARAGFELRPRHRTAWARLDDWYLRWLMAYWSPEGRRRLARGPGRLRSEVAWLSTSALIARYGGTAAR